MSATATLTSALTGMLTAMPQIDAELGEVESGLQRLRQGLLGQRDQARLAGAGHERARHQHAVLRMARAREGLGADELLFAQIDLRLVPELDPVVAQGLVEIDAAGDRRRVAELKVLQNFQDDAGLERLFQHRQHLQALLLADALDVREHGRAAAAHELHVAAIAARAERDDAFDGFGGFQRDVEEDEIGRALRQRRTQRLAVGEFLGIDAGAVKNERQEMADARIGVDDEAERGAGLAGVRRAAGGARLRGWRGCGGLRSSPGPCARMAGMRIIVRTCLTMTVSTCIDANVVNRRFRRPRMRSQAIDGPAATFALQDGHDAGSRPAYEDAGPVC